jgi:gliding motility-associated-like protein
MKYLFSLAFVCVIFSFTSSAQQNTTNWQVKFEDSKSFIENKGQFDGRNHLSGSEILFAGDFGAVQVYLTKNGVTYYTDSRIKDAGRKKWDTSKPKFFFEKDIVHLEWVGADNNVKVIGENKQPNYHVYAVKGQNGVYSVDGIKGYKKIIYKDLYPNIDLEYIIHPKSGIKYSFILHPGANVSDIKMQYSSGRNITLNENGAIQIKTISGDIIEHAPVTFYSDNSDNVINSKFIINNNEVSFALANYDISKTIVIDPWVQTPTLASSNCVWECERDGAGNVYIIGGDKPMKVQKYNATGVLQWTYNTPWDTTNGSWLGTIATDLAGNSYVTNGSSAQMQKINTNGTMVWYQTGPIFNVDEYWSIAFNCDQTKLIVGGTKGSGGSLTGAIFDINTSNGNITNSVNVVQGGRTVTVTVPGFPPISSTYPNEVRAITSSRNAKYYYLTHDTVGAINQNITACSANPLFNIKSTYEFGYKCEDWRPLVSTSDGGRAGNSGICAISANENFVYTQNGATVHKRSLATGAILASAAIPGGISNAVQYTTPIMYQPGNSGIDIDDCGNVYVGSGNAVIKYDANLTFITSVPTQYKVFDVEVTLNGEVIVCGSTGTSLTTPRTGYIEVVNMSACAPFALICCDATVCPILPLCSTDAPRNLTPIQSGGTWSGPGITNTSTGTFSPSVAGVGVHKIAYTLSCGSDTVEITVYDCSQLNVCKEPNGDLTVSGGSAPYTWYYYTSGSTTPITNQAQCQACGYTWFGAPFSQCFSTFPIPADDCVVPAGWVQFGTGTTVTPPSYPVRVSSAAGTNFDIQNATSVPNCTTVVCPTVTVAVTSQTNVSCAGGNNGSATVNATGGASPYNYTWQPGNVTGATRNNLTAGTYTVVASDANACTGTVTVTITAPVALSANATATPATCSGNTGTATVNATNGTSPYTYLWSNGATTQSINGLASGSYTVTVRDANNCSTTATANVSSSGGATVTLNTKTDINCFGNQTGVIDINVTVGTPPYTYTWSNGATTQDLSALATGTYTVTVRDNNNCQTIFSATINEPAALVVNGTSSNPGCGANDGSISLTTSGGTSPYVFNWSNGATTQNLTNVGAGNFSVTITDNNGCADSLSFTLTSPGGIVASLSATDASCQGVNDGTVTATVSGGATPYTYSWSNSATTQNLSNVGPGNYTLTVTDAVSCTEVQVISVGALNSIVMTANITGVQCEYDTIGAIKLITSGGTAPYISNWSNGDAGETITELSAGNYGVTVTDANGCTADTVFALLSNSGLNVNATVSGLACDGTGNATATATTTGNVPPFTYEWNTGATSQSISNIAAGVYTVTVTDNLDCIAADTVTVGVASIVILEKNITQPECDTTTDGAIEILLVGGNDGYTFEWDNGQDSSVAINLTAGVYTVTITDFNDCFLIDTTNLTAERFCADTLIIYDVFSPNGDGKNDLWVIDGLENYPDNELQVYNRWGSMVYEQKPYTNNWNGGNKKGEPLPSATYYYILKLNDTENQIFSGHVTIIR